MLCMYVHLMHMGYTKVMMGSLCGWFSSKLHFNGDQPSPIVGSLARRLMEDELVIVSV